MSAHITAILLLPTSAARPLCPLPARRLARRARCLLLTPVLPAAVVEAVQAAQQQQLVVLATCWRQRADGLAADAARLWSLPAQRRARQRIQLAPLRRRLGPAVGVLQLQQQQQQARCVSPSGEVPRQKQRCCAQRHGARAQALRARAALLPTQPARAVAHTAARPHARAGRRRASTAAAAAPAARTGLPG